MSNFLFKIKQKFVGFWKFMKLNFFNMKEFESILQTFLSNLVVDEIAANSLNMIVRGDVSSVVVLAGITAMTRALAKAIWQVVKNQILNREIIIPETEETN